MNRKLKVLSVQDIAFYKYNGHYTTYDVLVNWYGLLAEKVDLTIAARVFDQDQLLRKTDGNARDIAVKSRVEDSKILERLHRLDESINLVPLPTYDSLRQLPMSPGLMLQMFQQLRRLVKGQDVVFTNFTSPSAVLTWLVVDSDTPVLAMFRSNMLRAAHYRYSGVEKPLAIMGVYGIEGMAGLLGRLRNLWISSIGIEGVKVARKLGLKAIKRYDTNITLKDIEESRHFTRKYEHDGPIRLIKVTRFEQEKGADVMIEAARLLKAQGLDFHLKIVGRGGLRRQFEQRILELGLQERVELVDFMPRQELFEEYKKADILVNAAYDEGVPIIFFESGLWGLPIVATDTGGIADAYPHMKRAYIVPRGNPWALAEGVRKLALSPELRKQLGTASREFSYQHPMEKDIDDLLERIMQWTAGVKTK